jgi:hypothetical protein
MKKRNNQMNPPIRLTMTILAIFIGAMLISFVAIPAQATTPGPPSVTSLFVPIEGNIIEPGTTNVLHLTGEVHVLTQVTFSDTEVPSVEIWANLVRVRGTSDGTGITYLGVGADNIEWLSSQPGPPNIPEQEFTFTLVSVQGTPGPPRVPPSPCRVFLDNFVFGAENTNFGELLSVDASFR